MQKTESEVRARMKEYPKVSIILPIYNGGEHSRTSIESCLRQTYPNFELVIVDDGSADETPEIIRSYQDPRIRSVRHKKNRGLPMALNTGFAHATGDYLTWTSHDNEFLPEAVEEMVAALEGDRSVDLVYTDVWIRSLETGKKVLRKSPDRLDLSVENQVGACFLFTRRVYETIGGYDPKYKLVEDYEYWIRICQRFRAVRLPRSLYIYGEHGKSLTRTQAPSIFFLDRILKYRYGYIGARELGRSLVEYCSHLAEFKAPKTDLFITLLKDLFQAAQISWRLGLFVPLLLLYFIPARLGQRFFLRGWEYRRYLAEGRKEPARKPAPGKKNILCLIPWMMPGGAERVILNVARAADRDRFNFHLMTTFPAENVWVDQFRPYFANVIVPFQRGMVETLWRKYLGRVIRELPADLLLITTSDVAYKVLPSIRSEFPGLKVMDILHAENHLSQTMDRVLITPYRYLDRRICISRHLQNSLARKYAGLGLAPEYAGRLEVIHNGIDIREYNRADHPPGGFRSRYGIPGAAKVVTYIGRFSAEKNPFQFIEIARDLVERSQQGGVPEGRGNQTTLRFVMAGDGPELARAKSKAAAAGLNGSLLLPGPVCNVPELLADTDALVIPSQVEGIPLAALEAMAMRVPVVAANVGALHEIIENRVNGFLIEPGTGETATTSFAETVLEVISGNGGLEHIVSAAAETVAREYTLEKMGEGYTRAFTEVLTARNSD